MFHEQFFTLPLLTCPLTDYVLSLLHQSLKSQDLHQMCRFLLVQCILSRLRSQFFCNIFMFLYQSCQIIIQTLTAVLQTI